MNKNEFKTALNMDRSRYGGKSFLQLYFLNAGFRITYWYRRCSYLKTHKWLKLFHFLPRLVYHGQCVKFGCDIPSNARIGNGLKIDHPVGIIINSQAVIGENFTIKSGAVVGKNERGVATIGDNVTVGVHALIIGPVQIGDHAVIGAGAIVTHDVQGHAVAVCDAAHILEKIE